MHNQWHVVQMLWRRERIVMAGEPTQRGVRLTLGRDAGTPSRDKTCCGGPAIRRVNFVDQAYAAIRQMIVSGRLTPGTQLKMETLSSQLGVSNSPIREALRRLENERWVETVPYRGSFVRPLEETELIELYEIREFIELAALRKAMPKPPADHLVMLERAARDIKSALTQGDAVTYLTADTHFHQAIVDIADNGRLSEIFATLVVQGRCFMLGRTPEAMAAHSDGLDQHAKLFELICQGETRKALTLLKHHLHVSLNEMRKPVKHKQP